MRRKLATLAVTVSLLVSVVTCIFWVRSYSHMTSVVLRRLPQWPGERLWGLTSAGGGLHLSTMHYIYPAATRKRFMDVRLRGLRGDVFGVPDARFAGFTYQRERPFGYNPGQPQSWRIPFWFIASLTAAPFAFRMVLVLAARRQRLRAEPPGICRHCGYDLRATPELCPECGAASEHATSAAAKRQCT